MRNGAATCPTDSPGAHPALIPSYHFALKPSISGRFSVPGFRYQ